MLHRSETWPVRKENVVALQRAEMRMVTWICGIKRVCVCVCVRVCVQQARRPRGRRPWNRRGSRRVTSIDRQPSPPQQ